MRRVSFFVHDLSSNPIVRAAPLALAITDTYDVEMLGFLHGEEVYPPYRDVLPYRTLRCSRDIRRVLAAAPALAAMATGDVIYACKPLVTSLGPALIASRFGRRRPLLLDVEDDEWVPMGRDWREFLLRDVVRGWRHATALKYTRLLHPFVRCARGVTVASRALQRRYGGILLRHGPDERVFDPVTAPSAADARVGLGLPPDAPLALFAGLPQPHKGFDVLRAALQDSRAADWHLVLAGDPEHPEFIDCSRVLAGRCHRIGLVAQGRMPALLASSDAVPVPQRRVRFAESQIPAKALEAMAMARAVVATRVGDLPEILGEGERGWLVEPESAGGLAVALEQIARQPAEAVRRGEAARQWFLKEASRSAIRDRLVPLIARALASPA